MTASLGIRVIRSSLTDWRSMKKECRHARHTYNLSSKNKWQLNVLQCAQDVFAKYLSKDLSKVFWHCRARCESGSAWIKHSLYQHRLRQRWMYFPLTKSTWNWKLFLWLGQSGNYFPFWLSQCGKHFFLTKSTWKLFSFDWVNVENISLWLSQRGKYFSLTESMWSISFWLSQRGNYFTLTESMWKIFIFDWVNMINIFLWLSQRGTLFSLTDSTWEVFLFDWVNVESI